MFPHLSKLLVAFLFVFSSAAGISGQEGQAPPPDAGPTLAEKKEESVEKTATLTIEKIAAKLKAIEDQEGLDAELKTKVVDLYKQAQSALEDARSHREQAENFKKSIESAPGATQEIRDRLKQAAENPEAPPETPADGTTDLSVEIRKLQAEIATANSAIQRRDAEIATRQGRPAKAREEQLVARERLAAREKALKVDRPPGENKLFSEATSAALEARREARADEVAMLEQELLSHEARLELLKAEQEDARDASSRIEARLKVLQDAESERRNAEAEAAKVEAEQTRREAEGKHPLITAIAEENSKLGDDFAKIALEESAVRPVKDRTAETNKQLQQVYSRTRAQIELVGVGGVGGKVLRDRKKQLPAIRSDNRVVAARWSGKIAAAEARSFQISIDQNDLGDLDLAVERRFLNADPPVPEGERAAIAGEVKELLSSKVELLDKLGKTYVPYIEALRQLETSQQELEKTAKDFTRLLDEWLLWIPSSPAPSLLTLSNLWESIKWLCSPGHWVDAGSVLVTDVRTNPALAGITFLLCACLFLSRTRLRRRYFEIADLVGRVEQDAISHTLFAILTSLLMVAPISLAIAYVGWRLSIGGAESPAFSFVDALGHGLLSVAGILFTLRFFGLICGPRGVAELHFRWRKATLALLRQHLAWLIWILPVTYFFVRFTDEHPNEDMKHSLGRLAFVIGMGALGIFIQRVIRPNGALISSLLAKTPDGWLSRLRYLWYPIAVGVPLVLAGVAAVGYYYTAIALEDRLTLSVDIIIGAILIEQLGQRWLVVTARRLAVKKAREARKAREEAAKAAGQTEDQSGTEEVILDVPEVDISTVNQQTRRLLATAIDIGVLFALWGIWASVLPALGILSEVQLWQTQAVDETGAQILEWVTLQHLIVAIIAFALTIVAAKNLPGLLEIAVLKNLPLEAGMRYALSTLSQYIVTAVGVLIAFKVLGFHWAQVQFLAAALGVGIGFALGEIIANFFCGLILLFERPIRVGDIVTVGDVMGTVSRIRIRATTITNWDRMEYIVPNKELITGRLLNWTLSNTINRIVINVGVAYGSDLDKARTTLLKVAQDHPLIMDDPGPIATFEGFGDSTLNLVLRAYLPDFANRLGTINELHANVDVAFKQAGLEIAFPQLDLHLRTGALPEVTKSDAPPK